MKELMLYIKDYIINPILVTLGFKKNKPKPKEKECEFKDVDKYVKNIHEVEKHMLEYYGLKEYSTSNEREIIIPQIRYAEHKMIDMIDIPEDYERNQRVIEYVMERDKVTEYIMTRDRDNRTMHQRLIDFENSRPIGG